jgi:hypothetical protein
MSSDYADEWQRITRRWARGRRDGLVHLIVVPILIYLASIPLEMMLGEPPVVYFLVAFALWLVVFVYLLLRDRYYTCPACQTRVRPFGGTDMPDWQPHPCPTCGLRAPSPPYR